MHHAPTPVLEILVHLTRDDILSFQTDVGDVSILPFTGTVQSPYFTGKVAPGGVDTQTTDPSGIRHMSARYTLVGTDADGNACHIYVENNGYTAADAFPNPFHTVPTFYTDSPCLAPILHRRGFVGEGTSSPEGLWIRFYPLSPLTLSPEKKGDRT